MPPWTLPRRARAALFLALFGWFMLTTSRERPWSDATVMWQLADAIVDRGAIDVETAWPPNLPRGRDGKVYPVAPLLHGLMHVPSAALHRAISAVFPQARVGSWPIVAHLAPAALGAGTGLLLLALLARLGVGRAAALATVAAMAAATTIWVYARSPYSEILQAFCFTGLVLQLVATAQAPSRRAGIALGLWAGLLVNAKLIYAVSLPGVLVYLALRLRPRWRELGAVVGWAAAGGAPLLAVLAAYNWARWGSPLQSGYALGGGAAAESLPWGLWGLFLSPGKSVLVYSPPLVLSAVGAWFGWRRWRDALLAVALPLVPVVLVYARFLYWSGDYAWGPRYLVFAVPVLLVPAALLVEHAARALAGWRRRLAAAGGGLVLAAGLAVQLLGNAFFWDHFIRLQREARNRWLGTPNASGTPFPDFGGVCGACFEDMHGMIWLPPFQPIQGHWWLLRHVPFGHDWVRAEADAPWHRYTSLRLDIAHSYQAARIDWWFLNFIDDGRRDNRVIGLVLLALMACGTLGGLWWLRRALRASAPSSTPRRSAAAGRRAGSRAASPPAG